MKSLFGRALCLLLVWCAGAESETTLRAQGAAAPAPPVVAPGTQGVSLAPPMPTYLYQPPTEFFRKLLKLDATERAQSLSNRPAQFRAQLEAKIQEYQAMTPEAREAKLWATELREYLNYFVKTPPPDRSAQVALIPDEYRQVVSDRLAQLDLLPPGLREEVLSQPSSPVKRTVPMPPTFPPRPPDPLKALGALSPEQREQMYASLEDYFDLDGQDQQKILATLPAPERIKVARTLRELQDLPHSQREQGLQAINALAGMTDEQRRVFFNNTARWQAMSPAERQTWLKLITRVPPMPPPFPGLNPQPSLATNPHR